MLAAEIGGNSWAEAKSIDEQTIVVVPSMTLDKVEDVGSMMQPYEVTNGLHYGFDALDHCA